MAKNRVEYERSAAAIHQWLDALELEDTNEVDVEELGNTLDDLNLLSWAGAPDSDLCAGVEQARRTGCGWAPIALALGIPRQEAREHFAESPEQSVFGHPPTQWLSLVRALDTRVTTLAHALFRQRPPQL